MVDKLSPFLNPIYFLRGPEDQKSNKGLDQKSFEQKIKDAFLNSSFSERTFFIQELKTLGIKSFFSQDKKLAVISYDSYFKEKNGSRISKNAIGPRTLRSVFVDLEKGIFKTTLTRFVNKSTFKKCIITKKLMGHYVPFCITIKNG